MTSGKLEGKRAVVTGGCGGMGRAICRRFAAEGATVTACDVARTGEPIADSVSIRHLDITDEDAVVAFARDIGNDPLDILVNAAGIEIEKTLEETTLEEWNRIFAANVTGMFLMSKHLLPQLRASDGASIVNIGSYNGFMADPGVTAYCATKGAVHALTKAMASDFGPEGIRVNAVCPGYIDTPMLQGFFKGAGDIESLGQAVRELHPTRRFGTPEDIANLVNWLASDEARYASGQLWVLDGGLTAQAQQMRL